MGLDIRTVSYSGNTIKEDRFGSYGRIHVLRKWIYKTLDGYTDEQIEAYYDYKRPPEERIDLESKVCPAICNHCDSEGGYLNPEDYKVEIKDPMFWADIRDLDKELKLLNPKRMEMPEEVRLAFEDLRDFARDSEGELVSIIYFN